MSRNRTSSNYSYANVGTYSLPRPRSENIARNKADVEWKPKLDVLGNGKKL